MAIINLKDIKWSTDEIEFDDTGVIYVKNPELAERLRELRKHLSWVGTAEVSPARNIACLTNASPCKPPTKPNAECVNDLCPCKG